MVFMTCSTTNLWGPPTIQAELTGPWVRLPPSMEKQLKAWPKNQSANMAEYIFKDLSEKFSKINWSDRTTALNAPTAIGRLLREKYNWSPKNYYTNVIGTDKPFQIHYILVQLRDKSGFVWELRYWIIEPYDIDDIEE
jgi:hypothetical protein